MQCDGLGAEPRPETLMSEHRAAEFGGKHAQQPPIRAADAQATVADMECGIPAFRVALIQSGVRLRPCPTRNSQAWSETSSVRAR